MVKTFVYQSMDPGLNPGEGKFFFFFSKNAKISRRIYASLACKGLTLPHTTPLNMVEVSIQVGAVHLVKTANGKEAYRWQN